MDKKDLFALTFLFLLGLIMWTLPIQKSPMPYSEVDGCHHFSLANEISSNNLIKWEYSYYMLKHKYSDRWKEGIAYSPHWFINLAIGQVIGGDSILSFFVFLSIINFAVVFSVYFLIRKLYNSLIAFFSGLLLIFSGIDVLSHIMGQWTAMLSFACIPIIIYCYYKYIQSYLNKKEKTVYLFIIPFLILTQFGSHYQAIIHSILIITTYTIFILIKERKIMFNYKNVFIAVILLVLLLGPFITQPTLATRHLSDEKKYDDVNIMGLFDWFSEKVKKQSFPPQFFSYSKMHGLWTSPLLVIGLIFLLLRRKNRDFLLLSWILALYTILHSDILFGFQSVRIPRSLIDLPHLIYPLIMIGAFSIPSIFKVNKKIKVYLKYSIIIILLFFIVTVNAKSNYNSLNNAYPYPIRINPYQYQAADWLRLNTQETTNIGSEGVIVDKTRRWIRSISQRNFYKESEKKRWGGTYPNLTSDYFFIDYNDFIITNNQQAISQLQNLEKLNFENITPVYNQNNIRIYKLKNEN